MTRRQRTAHRLVWLVLAPLLVLLVAYALVTRADEAADLGTVPAAPEGRR